jgi:phytoene dehydrogenase-like protein
MARKFLVLEKHDKAGGFCTSFRRKDTQFNCGIDSLHELKPNETMPQFFKFGQWVFPGFGIAGVMASGYYLAKDLLKDDNVNLEKDFKLLFKQ